MKSKVLKNTNQDWHPNIWPPFTQITNSKPQIEITHGKNAMGPHASQLNKDERWKVAMYVRTMQFDGDLNMGELTAQNATTE